MRKLLYTYKNWWFTVKLFDDWTKIWNWEWEREFPDSMDVKITNYCDAWCWYCHEMSTIEWKHGDLSLFLEWIKKLPKWIEIAIGGGNPLSHPEILPFLQELKSSWYVPNLTVNAIHQEQITKEIEDAIYGIWVSYTREITYNNPNMVIHFIAWVHPHELIKKHLDAWYKCLILWYKTWWRGIKWKNLWVELKIKQLTYHLPEMKWLLAFDSLAVKQLNPQNIVSSDYWNTHYTGDDGTLSMYFDLVKWEYCKNSFAKKRYKFDGDIITSFNNIKYD